VSRLATIGARLDALPQDLSASEAARTLLEHAEAVPEEWVRARCGTPTDERREGFRLLALHRQATRGEPSFNACRETRREIAYHYNLLCGEAGADAGRHRRMMVLLVRHLLLFVSGKLESARLGEFCCSSRPLRIESA